MSAAHFDVLAEVITKLSAQRPSIDGLSNQKMLSGTLFIDYDKIDMVEREEQDVENMHLNMNDEGEENERDDAEADTLQAQSRKTSKENYLPKIQSINVLGKLEQIFEQQMNRDVYEIMNDLYKIQQSDYAKVEAQLVERKNENDKMLKHEEEMIAAGQSFKDDFAAKNQQLDRDLVHKRQELEQASKIGEVESLRAKERYMSQIQEKDAIIVDLQGKANTLAEQVNQATDALLKSEQARDFEVSQHENRIRKQQGDLESLEAQLHEQQSRD